MNFKKVKLKNGLRVILANMPETQTVTVQILVEVGSKYEIKKINGVSHFLEHMIFKGTKKKTSFENSDGRNRECWRDVECFYQQRAYWLFCKNAQAILEIGSRYYN